MCEIEREFLVDILKDAVRAKTASGTPVLLVGIPDFNIVQFVIYKAVKPVASPWRRCCPDTLLIQGGLTRCSTLIVS